MSFSGGQIMHIPLLHPPLIFRPSYGPAFPNVKHWWGHNLFAYSRSKTTFPYMPNVPSLLGKNLIAKIVSLGLVSMYVWQNVRAAGTFEDTSELVLTIFWHMTYISIRESRLCQSHEVVPTKHFDIPAALSVPICLSVPPPGLGL